MDQLEKIDRALRGIPLPGALTGVGLELRSCRCRLLKMEMEGVDLNSWKGVQDKAVNIIEDGDFYWDLLYLGFFPGTEMVRRAIFRKFCGGCLENYLLDGSIGMSAMVAADNTGEKSKES